MELTSHGQRRVDPWGWLRSKESPEVLDHLEAENAYTKAVLGPAEELAETILAEIKARIVEDDTSVPTPRERYEYYSRTAAGSSYPQYCRRVAGGGDEEVMLDVNELALEGQYRSLGALAVSPDEERICYSVDLDGSERYELRVRELWGAKAGHERVVATEVAAGGCFAGDSQAVCYVRDDDAHRPYQGWVRVEGTDHLVLEESDASFYLSVGRSQDQSMIVWSVGSKETSESWVQPADQPLATLRSVAGRQQGVQYSVHPHSPTGQMILRTNEDAPEFRLLVSAWSETAPQWSELVAEDETVRIDDVLELRDHLVLSERSEASTRLRVLELASGALAVVSQDEEAATIGLAGNARFEVSEVRYSYESLTTPPTTYTLTLGSGENLLGERSLLKQQEVRGHDPERYESSREWVTSRDGVQVPVSLVWKAGAKLSKRPALLYAYASYEHSTDPWFSAARLSLLDRGFVFGIVHARGGGELGRTWYDEGKLSNKSNTFEDVEAAIWELRARGILGETVIRGGSAGGLTVGAVLNRVPEMLAGVVAEVPFVDCLNTMEDESLPLTILEYEEWGSPKIAEEFEWISSYAPYENVPDASFPPVLATAGLNDPRVGYWEPAKWVQQLRAHQQGSSPIVLRTEMGAGHGGPSGRYDAWAEEAETLAFVISCCTGTLASVRRTPERTL